MEFTSIASGSSGNCLYAGNDDTHILIDAGISKKRIEEGLRSAGCDPRDIDALFITHEHIDNVSDLGVFTRKYHVPVYATRGTISAVRNIRSLGEVDDSLFHVIRPQEDVRIGTFNVHPFSVSHDARDPVAYRISDPHYRVGTVTDLGFFDDSIVSDLQDCDLLYIEANHDVRMLETGPYPYRLKVRIAGNYGHLSNEDAGQLACRLMNEKVQHIILGHLSKENNYPALALAAVRDELDAAFEDSNTVLPALTAAPRSCPHEKIILE